MYTNPDITKAHRWATMEKARRSRKSFSVNRDYTFEVIFDTAWAIIAVRSPDGTLQGYLSKEKPE